VGTSDTVAEGESLQSVVDQSMNSSILGWVGGQRFPDLVFARYEDLGIGSSVLTMQGEQAADSSQETPPDRP
jgi:hypothetical protein